MKTLVAEVDGNSSLLACQMKANPVELVNGLGGSRPVDWALSPEIEGVTVLMNQRSLELPLELGDQSGRRSACVRTQVQASGSVNAKILVLMVDERIPIDVTGVWRDYFAQLLGKACGGYVS